ncbi:hypothetical protein BG000_000143 [Podila horticola]|nr:hypothetical protein BG000_000143 [Podila horticola]
MKIVVLTLAALTSVTVTLAAPAGEKAAFDGNSKCVISAFKPSWTKINECCLKNKGGSEFVKNKNYLKCTLPITRGGPMRKCVKDLGFASVVDCDY